MKRSEMKKVIQGWIDGQPSWVEAVYATAEDPAEEILRDMEEEDGVQWDPEEEAPGLRPCPACGGEARKEEHFGEYFICSHEGCEVAGPSNDPTGAKWNALPRREAGPEARGLPGRVEAVYGYCRGTVIRVKTRSNEVLFSARCQTDRADATLREALRRYNAVGRILEVMDQETSVSGRWRSVADACRSLHDILKDEGVIR